MVTTSTWSENTLEQRIRNRAREYLIPAGKLQVSTYEDTMRMKDVVRISFRCPHSREKYQTEMILGTQASGVEMMELVTKQLDNTLKQLEEHWLKNGGTVTFYKNHGFFYRFKESGRKASLEVECTVCNHGDMVHHPRDILDEYRDLFLVKMLPKVHAECDCPSGRYAAVQRPRLHDL